MTLSRWRPFRDIELWEPIREMESLQQEMNRLFDRLMHPVDGASQMMAFRPSMEMEETAEEICLKLEVPGLEAKDIDIQVAEDAVTISGDRQEETKTEEKGMMRSEFRYGRFERVIPLPTRVQNDQAKAEYQNGILRLTLPKAEEDKKKVVKVSLD